MNVLKKINNNKFLILFVKIALSLCIIFIAFTSLFVYGLRPYYSYKDYSYQNDFSTEHAIALNGITNVKQRFVARGNLMNSLSVYIGDIANEKIDVSIYQTNGAEIASYTITADGADKNSWNKLLGLKTDKLVRGKEYIVEFKSVSELKPLVLNTQYAPVILESCISDGAELSGKLAIGFQFTYRYMTLGSFCELALSVLFTVVASLIMCIGIFNFENFFSEFISHEKKKGGKAAVYFSVSFVLLYNPIESIRTEVSKFGRIMGAGFVENVDVSKRTGNFNFWFILLAISFSLFLLVFNHIFCNVNGEENKKVSSFLDHFFVVANCSLLLRCITYFNDESSVTSVFYFTTYAMMLISLTAILYIVLNFEKKLSAGSYAKLQFIGLAVSFPLAIFTSLEFGKGRVWLGWWGLIAITTLIFCKKFITPKTEHWIKNTINAIAMMAALLPLLTSLYIELIHVLNQYKIFVAHPAKDYEGMIIVFVLLTIGICILIKHKGYELKQTPTWLMPLFVFGVSCLSVQIPLSSTYNPDLFESANYSILISDLFNYGKIPIVEHYGGHMMTAVWEGILYGVINQDFSGAVVSPYSQMILPFLVVLFYFLLKEVWNSQIAPIAALLFPFYDFWSYYGLGMLICLAVVAYAKKNTYVRAALIWFTFVWCAIYRLDLGFAFGAAILISLCTYIIITRNRLAIKQLGTTLGIWGVIGLVAWCIICLIKGVKPINRLLEFLMINLSNQNWAYTGIGDAANTLFGWSYVIVPFASVLGLLFTTFSKHIRERIGITKWMILLIFGWSYFENFSRGLVRHSLAESATTVVIWSGYLFLALFISSYVDNKKIFLPVFMLFILCNTLFLQDGNFTFTSIAENAVDRPAAIMESWKPGRFSEEEYEEKNFSQSSILQTNTTSTKNDLEQKHSLTLWEQIKLDGKRIERVKLDADLEQYVNKYKEVLSVLLKDDETFVDFINKTLLFSLLGKENPVYVSQSPLQLSGEYTQEEFIREMTGVPLILMPIDADNYRSSNSLDGLTNAYRYYKVAEYIYRNYQPLCRYGTDYAVWCLKKRADQYKNKLKNLTGRNYIQDLIKSETIGRENVNLISSENRALIMSSTGTDPKITELQTILDTSEYLDDEMQICIEYNTDTDGSIQLFYTTEQGENYSEEKVATENISGAGKAYFTIPITEYSRLRLDIPDGSQVEIKSFMIESPIQLIEYGYDGPITNTDVAYIGSLHNHNLGQLPRIWAEEDEKKASKNSVFSELASAENTFDPSVIKKEVGNYLLISASYDGIDKDGLYYDDDEQTGATVVMGKYENGVFDEKCRYAFSIKEGKHDYLIRCSTDYYWYLNEINAVRIQSDGKLYNVSMKILEGD